MCIVGYESITMSLRYYKTGITREFKQILSAEEEETKSKCNNKNIKISSHRNRPEKKGLGPKNNTSLTYSTNIRALW